MPDIDDIRTTAERISGNPSSGAIRLFIDDLIHALDEKEAEYGRIPVTELREQPRLQ
jgi:hypothetical protein